MYVAKPLIYQKVPHPGQILDPCAAHPESLKVLKLVEQFAKLHFEAGAGGLF